MKRFVKALLNGKSENCTRRGDVQLSGQRLIDFANFTASLMSWVHG